MRVLVAPDKFKGTLTAVQAAQAMANGIRKASPETGVVLVPVADGGDGTLDVLDQAWNGHFETIAVRGPWGDLIEARVGLFQDANVVEMSMASGLSLLGVRDLRASEASSFGTGECLARALRVPTPTNKVLLAIGGSVTTDGGTGAASACGWRFLDGSGRDLPPGGAALRALKTIVPPVDHPVPSGVEVVGACDVSAPLLGPGGAAHRFSPQKGATPDEVEELEEAMSVLASVLESELGVRVADAPGAGAGGGMGAGLVAFFKARLESGFGLVADALDLEERIAGADLVITGEGRLDEQSLQGKATIGVARIASKAGVPVGVVAGSVALSDSSLSEAGFADWETLVRPELELPGADASQALARATGHLFVRMRS